MYGPPDDRLRLTLYFIAPSATFQASATCVSPGRAVRFVGVSGGRVHARSALFTCSRPPVVVMPASADRGPTVPSSVSFSASVSMSHADSTSAAAPETCGVAIDVPLRKLYVPPVIVERMSTPGAARCTDSAP